MKTKAIVTVGMLCLTLSASAWDNDGSGLSDVFEFIYSGGRADPLADPDGDGFDNLQEMVWGTDPTSAASFPGGTTAVIVGEDLVLSWPVAPGRQYRLETTVDLEHWDHVLEGQVSSYRTRVDAASQQFWRVQMYALPPGASGFAEWEEALWVAKYGKRLEESDLDGDGLSDAEEFVQNRQMLHQDHPAVGLVVFTPLE